jgi:hypothetical protein
MMVIMIAITPSLKAARRSLPMISVLRQVTSAATARQLRPPLVLVQVKLLDGYSLSPLAIGCFDRAEIFARLRMMMTRQLRRLVGFSGLVRRNTLAR